MEIKLGLPFKHCQLKTYSLLTPLPLTYANFHLTMAESPQSALSEYSSEDFPEDVKVANRDHSAEPDIDSGRPSKRPRLGKDMPLQEPDLEDGNISSDTSGSVPASPLHPGDPDEYSYERQVTICKWEDCTTGDLGNMDNLVQHLHDDHIGVRQKVYSCEWVDCSRKGIPHASGYALRAHMRSHTREKPFFCTLPGSHSLGLALTALLYTSYLFPPL